MTLKIVNQFFCMTHCVMIIQHHIKLGKKIVEQFRRHQADTIGHTDRTTDGQSESNIPPRINGEGSVIIRALTIEQMTKMKKLIITTIIKTFDFFNFDH